MNPNLLNSVLPTWLAAAVAAANNTDDDSAIIDMANYEGVVFITTIEDSVDTGVATMTIEQNTANSGTGMAALSGAVDTLTSAANDDLNGSLLMVDVYRPKERYLRANRTSATANIAFGPVIAIPYGARKLPTGHTGTVVASPAEA